MDETNERREFTRIEVIYAWLCFAAGYLFWRIFPANQNPLGGFIFIVLLFAFTIILFKKKNIKISGLPIAAAISAVLISLTLIFNSNEYFSFLSFIWACAAYCYFVYASCGSVIQKGLSDYIMVDFIKALFIVPFKSFREMTRAMFSGKSKKTGGYIIKLLSGIAIALIPTAAVISLLSYDKGFSGIIDNIFSFDFVEIFSHIISLVFGVPVGMYLFGIYATCSSKKSSEILSYEQCVIISQKMKFIPLATALSAAAPLLIIYIIFFISQFEYYISGFTGKLPESFSYAEYAREGFFQLCAVSVINLVVIAFLSLTMKRAGQGKSPVLKILSILYSIFTLVLICTAFSKMNMYIKSYGLTQKRVYATWFMAVLAAIFVIIILKQFINSLHAAAASLLTAAVLITGLFVSNIDARIAKYNVNLYLSGEFESVDINAIYEMGDAGIPELARLLESLSDKTKSGSGTTQDAVMRYDIMRMLNSKYDYYENGHGGFFSITVPYLKARKAIESAKETAF